MPMKAKSFHDGRNKVKIETYLKFSGVEFFCWISCPQQLFEYVRKEKRGRNLEFMRV